MSRRLRVLVAVGAISVTGVVVGIAVRPTSAGPVNRQDTRTWIDNNGKVDISRVPARKKFVSDLAPGGIGWIDSSVLLDTSNAPVPIYRTESGRDVVGWFDPISGRHTRSQPSDTSAKSTGSTADGATETTASS